MLSRSLLRAASVAALVALAGCGTSASPTQADPTALLAQAKATMEKASTVAFTLTSKAVPASSDGVTAADGVGIFDASTPKFKGTFTGRLAGITGTIGLITIGPDAYVKFFDEAYKPFDLKAVDAPNPSDFFNTSTGMTGLLAKTTNPTLGAQVREGKDIVQEVTGTVPGAEIQRLFKLGDGTKPFTVTFAIADSGELRRTTAVGEFFAGSTSTYVIVLKDYGKTVEIARP